MMIPNNTFSYLKNQQFVVDSHSLIKCYQPIIGAQAFSLYHYLVAHQDGGLGRYRFSQILNHLNFGQQTLEKSLDLLTGMNLLQIFQEQEHYTLVLKPSLSQQEFLQEPLYRSLLTQRIGEPAVEHMLAVWPTRSENISKSFSQVFDVAGSPQKRVVQPSAFDSQAFQQLMVRNGLRFQNEKEDLIALYHMAEREKLSWLDLFQLAKETAVEGVLSTKRMQEKRQVKRELPREEGQFSKGEQALIRESKTLPPLEFLTAIKTSKRASVVASEKKCLQELANLGLLNEVINVIVLYTFNKVDSANLNEKYALKLGNDFSYQEIRTAEQAVERLRSDRRNSSAQRQVKTTSKASNIPSWSNPDYKDETTAEDLAELEKIQRQILANLEKGE